MLLRGNVVEVVRVMIDEAGQNCYFKLGRVVSSWIVLHPALDAQCDKY